MNRIYAILETIIRKIFDDSLHFFKMIAPVLLIISFLTVLIGWHNLKHIQILNQPIESVLTVPLILFGVIAIINIMLFAASGPSMFLAIFFVGTVVSGPELAERGAKIAANAFANTSSQYASTLGGIGTPNYSSGGISKEETHKDVKAESTKTNADISNIHKEVGAELSKIK